MRVAISGSHGLIGTALARSLRADGHNVVRLVRGGESSELAVPWDPARGLLDPSRLEGVDAVVHLAGAGIGDTRWTDERKRELRSSRVDSGRLLTEALASLDRPPAVYLGGSAIGIYGDRGDEVLDEESRPGTGFLAELCTEWEASAQPAVAAGIRVALLRTGIVLSTDGGALKRQLPLFRFGLGGPFGSGEQWTSWISIDDEVAAIRHLLEHDVSGPVNLTAPTPVTNREFSKALGAALHRPAVLPVPGFGPALLFGRQLVDEVLLASQRVLPAALQESGFTFRHGTLGEALETLLGPQERT